jgi:hypothetical protein
VAEQTRYAAWPLASPVTYPARRSRPQIPAAGDIPATLNGDQPLEVVAWRVHRPGWQPDRAADRVGARALSADENASAYAKTIRRLFVSRNAVYGDSGDHYVH